MKWPSLFEEIRKTVNDTVDIGMEPLLCHTETDQLMRRLGFELSICKKLRVWGSELLIELKLCQVVDEGV